MDITANVQWTSENGERRVILINGRYQPQTQRCGASGFGWYGDPTAKKYQTLRGAIGYFTAIDRYQ